MTPPSPSENSDLRKLLRKHALSAALSLVVIVAIAGLLAAEFQPQLHAFTEQVLKEVGLAGLGLLLFITDAFVSPFPPDSVLILIAASPHHDSWPWLLPLLGFVSSLAGCLGYFLGRILSTKAWAHRYFGRFHTKSEGLVAHYGPWAVALGALTPLPFSITCWTAGLLRLSFRSFLFPCMLRIPRYVAYYVAIAYVPKLFL